MSVDLLGETEKQIALSALQRMPESATLDEISEELAILAALRSAKVAADQGRTVTHAEVKERLAAWNGK